MCGIWAIFGQGCDRAADHTIWIRELLPRGPEEVRAVPVPGVGTLGFTRLAINGLNPAGMQPMMNADKTVHWMVNGELYNWRELALATGIVCTSGSDCEVLGALYEKVANGSPEEVCSVFSKLDGVFAAVIVDTVRNRILIARDPYGVRPLFWGRSFTMNPEMVATGGWAFKPTFKALHVASELKAIKDLAATVEPFPPGTVKILTADSLTEIWSQAHHTVSTLKLPLFSPPEDPSAIEAACLAVRKALEAAVDKRMMTERPVAALLSGGIDSSLIASLVAKRLRAAGAPRLKTFSVGMRGSSDLAYARKVADWIGSDHTEVVLGTGDFLAAIEPTIHAIESYDTTTVRASVGNWLVSKAVAEKSNCKVVFNGDGSDEVFGSYLYLFQAPSDQAYEDEVLRLLREIHTFDVLRSDRSISSHGLEARTPFLDKTFVQTVLSIPVALRRPGRGRPEKWLLRRAFDDGVTLPREVLWRRKEAFSDGVSGQDKAWYELAKEYAATRVPADWRERAVQLYPVNCPTTEEMYLYRSVFEKEYGPKCATATVPHFWMPKWSTTTDPSARTLAVYNTAPEN